MPAPPVASPPPRYTCLDYVDEVDVLVVSVNIECMNNVDADLYENFRRQLRCIRKYFKHERFILDFSPVREFTVDAFVLVECMRKKMLDAKRQLVLCGLNADLCDKLSVGRYLEKFSVCDTAAAARAIIRRS